MAQPEGVREAAPPAGAHDLSTTATPRLGSRPPRVPGVKLARARLAALGLRFHLGAETPAGRARCCVRVGGDSTTSVGCDQGEHSDSRGELGTAVPRLRGQPPTDPPPERHSAPRRRGTNPRRAADGQVLDACAFESGRGDGLGAYRADLLVKFLEPSREVITAASDGVFGPPNGGSGFFGLAQRRAFGLAQARDRGHEPARPESLTAETVFR
jgi:hypothetical protein